MKRFKALFKKRGKREKGKDARVNLGQAKSLTPISPHLQELMLKVPDAVLAQIFAYVCPHSEDETYDGNEDSTLDDRCMLCDIRDVAHCAQASKQWRRVALDTL